MGRLPLQCNFKEVKRMICPRCQNQVAAGVKFCPTCGSPMPTGQTPPPPSAYGAPPQGQYGAPPPQSLYGAPPPQAQYGAPPPQGAYVPPNQYEEYSNSMFGASVPKAELHNPKGPLKVGDLTVTIDGELVPVVAIMLGNQLPLSLDSVGQIVALRLQPGQMVEVREHQFLVATGNVDYGFTFMQGAANILFSRTGLFIDQFTARGGEGLVLLHGYGNVFEKMLAPGETLDIEPGAWLWKDPSVQMTVTTVASSQRGGGILGAIGGLVAGASFILNRFTGPGRVGIQSMSYHPPTPEGAQQAGGSSNLNLGNSFDLQF